MKMFVDGSWTDTADCIDVTDPFDGLVIDTVPAATGEDVDRAYAAAVRGFETTRRLTIHERVSFLSRAAELIRERSEDFAVLVAREGSKTIREARGEAVRAAETLALSAEEAKRLAGETLPFDSTSGGDARRGYFKRVPVGVVLAITPFNDPLNLVAHKVGPALAGGNSVVLKPARKTPLSAINLLEVLLEAGMPECAVQLVTGRGSEIGDPLVTDDRPRMISFTGGVETGRRVSRLAGLKKLGTELGSNSPVIVWKDADVETAASACVSGAFWAAGQNCLGVQRMLVHREIYEPFREQVVERTRVYTIGDKLDEATDMGPMISEGEARRVEEWVRSARSDGADVLVGGERDGTLMQPTVLESVPDAARVHCEEVFGPTVNLESVDDLQMAIDRANGTDYGLMAAVFTRQIQVAFEVAEKCDFGGVMINDSTDYRLDAMPFGGMKLSGLGREGPKFALQEMTEPKVVCFNLENSGPGSSA